MLNNFVQTHTIKIKVIIKKLHLKVRFPCSVSFQLKNQTRSTQTKSSYPLVQNLATVSQPIDLQIEAEHNTVTSRYQSEKISLVVYMISNNGRVIAGSIKFDVFQKNIGVNNQFQLNLDKCPDKDAVLYFSQSTQYMSESNRKFKKSAFSYINQLKHLSPRTRTNSYHLKSDSPPKTETIQYKKKPTFQTDVAINGDKYSTTVLSSMNIKNFSKFTQKTNFNGNDYKHSHVQSQSVRRIHQNLNNKDSKSNGDNRISASRYLLFDQKANKSIKENKSSQKKKAQNSYRHKEEIYSYENKIRNLKNQVQTLNTQIQGWEQKVKLNDKKQKNTQIMIRQLKEQIQKRKGKQATLNQKIYQFQTILSNKLKESKNLNTQLKSLQQQIQQHNYKAKTQQKKYQSKVLSLSQQLSKMDQKYKQSQKSLNQATFQYNNLLNHLEEGQKKQQLNARDKQKVTNQQKNKLTKKIQVLNQEISKLNRFIQDKDQALILSESQKKAIGKQLNNKDIKILSLQSLNQQLILQLGKELDQIRLYEKQLQFCKVTQTQRNQLKKKMIQVQRQITSIKQKNTTLQSNLNSLRFKQTALQQKLKQIGNQKAQLLSNQANLKRQLQSYQLNLKKLTKYNQNMQGDIRILNKTVSQHKNRLQSTNRASGDNKMQNQYKTTLLIKQKNMIESQLKEYKWTLAKQKQHVLNLQQRHTALNQEILALNQQLIDKCEKIKRNEQTIDDQRINAESLINQKSSFEKKAKQLTSNLRAKQDEIYQLKKKAQQADQQIYLTKDKFAHLQTTCKQNNQKHVKRQRQKQEIAEDKISELSQAEIRVSSLEQEIKNIKQQLSFHKKQVERGKFLYDQLKLQNQANQQKFTSMKHQKNSLQQKYLQIESSLKMREQTIQKIQRNFQRLSSQFQSYKKDMFQSLQDLFVQLSKQQQNITGTIVSFTLKGMVDSKLSKLQIQLIQKRNSMVLRHKSKVLGLNQSLELRKIQLHKLKETYQNNQKENEHLLMKQKQKLKDYQNQFRDHVQDLQSQLKNIEEKFNEKLSDLEKLNYELKNQIQLNEEQKTKIHVLITQCQSLKQQKKAFQNKTNELKAEWARQKAFHASKLNQLSSHLEQVISRLRQQLHINQKKLKQTDKKLIQKADLIKRQQNLLSKQSFEKEKFTQLYHQAKQRGQNLQVIKQQLTRRLKQWQKKSLRQHLELNDLCQKVQSYKLKEQDLLLKNRKANQWCMELKVQDQNVRAELECSREKSLKLQDAARQKGQAEKIQLQKQLQQIKTLSESVIQLKTQIEIMCYMQKQHQQTIKNLRRQLQSLDIQNYKKKEQILQKGGTIDSCRYSLQQVYNKINRIQGQKSQLQKKLMAKTYSLQSMNNMLSKQHMLEGELQKRANELIKLKDEKSNLSAQKQKQARKLRLQIKSLKSQLSALRDSQQQGRRKSKQLQYLLQQHNLDLYEQRRKWSLGNQRQKASIYKRIQMIQAQKYNLEEEYRFGKVQLVNEIDTLTHQYNQVVNRIKQVYEENKVTEEQMEEVVRKSQQISNQLIKTNKTCHVQKEELVQLHKELKGIKQKFVEKQTEKQALIKSHNKLLQNLRVIVNSQKQKAFISIKNQQERQKISTIFNKIQHTLKAIERQKHRN